MPDWKRFGLPGSGGGSAGSTLGLPRFREARFPFARISLHDPDVPLEVDLTGWSPFESGDADGSSLPVAALEYRFVNPSALPIDAVFSWNAKNFMPIGQNERAFSVTVSDPAARVNHAWFRGDWWDPLTMAWSEVARGACEERPPLVEGLLR